MHITSKEAVIFVDGNDEICVVDRKGQVDHLQKSPYNYRIDCCLAFLDEAHTRGIDIKLPKNYRAAVTLGANTTKDRLVQACMRMRKLGISQSIVFCISQEIQTKILQATSKSDPALQHSRPRREAAAILVNHTLTHEPQASKEKSYLKAINEMRQCLQELEDRLMRNDESPASPLDLTQRQPTK